MKTRIPLCVPSVGAAEEREILSALASGWVAPAGPQLDEFERELARLTERPEAVAVSSGTAALHLSLLMAGVSAGDEVAVPTLTFAATANAVRYLGATPLFIDCDATGAMSATLLEQALRDRHAAGRPIRAVVPVDLYGRVANPEALTEAAHRFGAALVWDAAESLGARSSSSRPAGAFGDFAALSFNGNKIVTTSSGGAVLCPDRFTAGRVRYLASQARQPVAHYEHTEIGYNYRLSNILAALGLAQLRRLPQILASKRAHTEAYREMAETVPGLTLLDPGEGNCWLNVLVLEAGRTTLDATGLAVVLDDAGIETRAVFKPMHLQPVFAGSDLSFITGRAEDLYRTGLLLPSSTDLGAGERDRVVATIVRALRLEEDAC
jgi:dTDP-4-amino-4,6-dideoxygalactose transaminase